MASLSENADRYEEVAPTSCTSQPEQKYHEPRQVLENMRNMIVEIQIFKAENKRLKKAQENQQGINEILLQGLQERYNGENPQPDIVIDSEVQESVGRKDSSSNGTQKSENRAKTKKEDRSSGRGI